MIRFLFSLKFKKVLPPRRGTWEEGGPRVFFFDILMDVS